MLQARELPQVTVPESILPYNEHEARMNIEKAAYLGFAKAQLKMGSAYELCSLGCEFDPALSMHYNALAARQGEAEAEMAISKWFLCGFENIFPKNEELAYDYGLRAAQSGLATAEFAMGYFNEIGMYVPVNLEKATEWYQKAANHGNQDAVGRIEGLKKSAVLSKKDHENVAVNKIKSQYGSMKGKRPDRLRAQAPALPSVTNEEEEYASEYSGRPGSSGRNPSPGRASVPPRTSSTTPYPMADGPPVVSQLPLRPVSTAPYPLDNGPPSAGGRSSLAGGFAPELRSHSAAPAQMRKSSGGAFNINPAIYEQQRPGPEDYGRPLPQGNMPPRPATTVADVGVGRGGRGDGRGPNPRTSSGPGGYGRQDSNAPPQPPQKLDIGYGAPGAGRANQSPSNVRPQVGPNDIGYIAPLQPRPKTPPQYTSASRPPRGDSRPQQQQAQRPQQQQQQQQQQRPQPGRQQSPGQSAGNRPPRQDSAPPKMPHTQSAPQPAAAKPQRPVKAATDKPQPHPQLKPPAAPSGKGPKTFEDMGVPKGEEKGDCVSSFAPPIFCKLTKYFLGCDVKSSLYFLD
jgi:hypothetical protein